MATNFNGIYGIGKGGAQVFGANPALEQLERQNFEEQKRKQREDAELNAEMQRVNYDGARQEDIPILIEGFNDVKKTFAELRQAKNAQERIQLASQLQDKKAKFTQMVGASKQAIKGIGEIDKLRLTKADELSDDFGEGLKALKGTSTFDKEFQAKVENLTNNAFRPKFDEEKYFKEKTRLFVEKVPESGIQIRTIPGIGKQAYTTSGDKLNKQAFVQGILSDAAIDKGLRYTIKQKFPDMPLSEAAILYANQFADLAEQQYGVKEKVVMSKADKDNSMTDYQRRSLALREAGGGSGNPSDYDVIEKTFYTKSTTDPNTGVKSESKPILPFSKYVAVNPVAFGLPQLESAYDISSGKNISKKALPAIEITGIGYTTVKGGKQALKVTLVDKDGKEYMINPNDVPVKTRMDKGYQAALKALGGAPSQPVQPRPQAKPSGKKTIKGF